MGRLGWRLIAPLALSLTAFGCGDDGATGGGTETETEGTGSSTGDASATNPTMTTMTTMSTQSGSSGTTDPTTGDPTTGVDSTGTPATDSGGTDTGATGTGGGMECEMCIEAECGDEIAACTGDMDCTCWIDCINMGNDQGACFGMCGPPPKTLGAVADCIDAECTDECAPDPGTTGTGGNMGDATYDMCTDDMDCTMDAPCNMFIGYCSVECMGDDNNCPAPPDGDITPECSDFSDQCILPCGNGGQCPTGMSCEQVGGGNQLCVFP